MKKKEKNRYQVILTPNEGEREIEEFDTLSDALGLFDYLCETEVDARIELCFRNLLDRRFVCTICGKKVDNWRVIALEVV